MQGFGGSAAFSLSGNCSNNNTFDEQKSNCFEFKPHTGCNSVSGLSSAGPAAYNCYIEALRIQPNFAIAWSNLAGLFMESGDLNRAVQYYKEVVKLKPTFSDAYLNLGNVYKAVDTVVAGILHDVVDDTCERLGSIEREFDDDVAKLVAGVSKLSYINQIKIIS